MAINIRVPDELDRRLTAIAADQHTSKSALLLQGAQLIVDRYSRRQEIDAGLDAILAADAELLDRLHDA